MACSAITAPLAIAGLIFLFVLARAPYRQRDAARAFVDDRFRPKIVPPSDRDAIVREIIESGERIDDLTRNESANVDDVYRQIADWEAATGIRLREIQARGGMGSGLNAMGSVDLESLHEYLEARLFSLWQGLQPHRMPPSHHRRPSRPRLSEPPAIDRPPDMPASSAEVTELQGTGTAGGDSAAG